MKKHHLLKGLGLIFVSCLLFQSTTCAQEKKKEPGKASVVIIKDGKVIMDSTFTVSPFGHQFPEDVMVKMSEHMDSLQRVMKVHMTKFSMDSLKNWCSHMDSIFSSIDIKEMPGMPHREHISIHIPSFPHFPLDSMMRSHPFHFPFDSLFGTFDFPDINTMVFPSGRIQIMKSPNIKGSSNIIIIDGKDDDEWEVTKHEIKESKNKRKTIIIEERKQHSSEEDD